MVIGHLEEGLLILQLDLSKYTGYKRSIPTKARLKPHANCPDTSVRS